MIQSLPGFREFYPEDCTIREYVFEKWKAGVRLFNFQLVDAPILEPLELFTEKSGPEITSQLFAFEDQGGRKVALRPEFTPSLVRLVGKKINSLKKPIQWASVVECFRYERPQKGRLRSFYQLNVDLLGESEPQADAYLIACLVYILKSFGLSSQDFYIRLSDRLLWTMYLESFNLSHEAVSAVLSIIDKLDSNIKNQAAIEKLAPLLHQNLDLFINKTQELLNIHNWSDLIAFFTPQSTPPLIKRLQEWKTLLDSLDAFQVGDFVRIDLSVVRGLTYYTGFVFEAFEANNKGRALAGGGRYDDLLKKMGHTDTPAVGLAIGDVTLIDLLKEKNLLPPLVPPPAFRVAYESDCQKEAFKWSTYLREQGYIVEHCLHEISLAKQTKQAYDNKSLALLVFTKDLLLQNTCKWVFCASKEEIILPLTIEGFRNHIATL